MRMRKRIWGSLGWCSADGGSGCSAVAGVKWEVVGGWVLWKEEMEAAGKPGLAVDFFSSLCLCLSGSGWGGCWVGEWVLMNGSHVAATRSFLIW